jgi:D-arginine dehydrogenase
VTVHADFLVIGAGIAGASVAYELAASARVVVLERELQLGYHSTGRSAALFSEIYGNATIRSLSRASRDFMLAPTPGFCETPLLQERGVLYVATAEQHAAIDTLHNAPDVSRHLRRVTSRDALELVPALRAENAAHSLYEPQAMDVDAAALYQAYQKGLRRRSGRIVTNCVIVAIERATADWCVHTADETFCAPILIDAAGAWADEIAVLAGVGPIGLEPRRRTALLIPAPAQWRVDRWPMVMDIEESFYFKPDAGKLMLSPADETACAPCDAVPDDLDVAIAVDRVERATTLSINHVTHRWAGLRTFAADRSPVVGYDDECEGFFWLAGQGGYGIQTAPALARISAALALHRSIPSDIEAHGIELSALSPRRLTPGTQSCSKINEEVIGIRQPQCS